MGALEKTEKMLSIAIAVMQALGLLIVSLVFVQQQRFATATEQRLEICQQLQKLDPERIDCRDLEP